MESIILDYEIISYYKNFIYYYRGDSTMAYNPKSYEQRVSETMSLSNAESPPVQIKGLPKYHGIRK